MLRSLRDMAKFDAIGVLSQLASDLAPERLEESAEYTAAVDFQSSEVLTEIYQRLRLRMGDLSPEAKDKVVNFITEQMRQIALRGVDEKRIKTSLANKGMLRPDLYSIIIPHELSEWVSGRGIRRQHIVDAVNYADKTERIPLRVQFAQDQDDLIFFLQQHTDAEASRNFTFLVVASRKGFELTIIDAMRIYPTDVDVANVSEPIDLLRVFLKTYGLSVSVGGVEDTLILFAEVPKSKLIGVVKDIVQVDNPEFHDARGVYLVNERAQSIGVTLAYTINDAKYRKDLKGHGVQVTAAS